ncbi:MAG: hypothetical protein HYY76_17270 [Acidobacteria bacterium]|nr:hypothetical protein [Acidobacteriota bacterium]
MSVRTIAPLLVIMALAVAPLASARYFGRNKVQYERFDFKVLATEHFNLTPGF